MKSKKRSAKKKASTRSEKDIAIVPMDEVHNAMSICFVISCSFAHLMSENALSQHPKVNDICNKIMQQMEELYKTLELFDKVNDEN